MVTLQSISKSESLQLESHRLGTNSGKGIPADLDSCSGLVHLDSKSHSSFLDMSGGVHGIIHTHVDFEELHPYTNNNRNRSNALIRGRSSSNFLYSVAQVSSGYI